MESKNSITQKEIEVAKRLFLDGFLPGPINCSCWGNDLKLIMIHQTKNHYALSDVVTINVGENIQ